MARAEKDGYTIGVMTAGQIIAAAMNKSLRYDTATAFEPISQVGTASLILVARADFPASNVNDLIAAAKANPGKIYVASPGFGATQHMSAELFKQTAGIECCRCIPHLAGGDHGGARQAGRSAVRHRAGGARPGAVRTAQGDRRHHARPFPDRAGCAGGGRIRRVPGYDVTTWYGFFAPRGTPPEIVAKLNKALNEALKDAAVREKLIKAGVAVQGSTPEEFGKFMAGELARWNKVREAAGIAQQ